MFWIKKWQFLIVTSSYIQSRKLDVTYWFKYSKTSNKLHLYSKIELSEWDSRTNMLLCEWAWKITGLTFCPDFFFNSNNSFVNLSFWFLRICTTDYSVKVIRFQFLWLNSETRHHNFQGYHVNDHSVIKLGSSNPKTLNPWRLNSKPPTLIATICSSSMSCIWKKWRPWIL